jgi:oxygen-independent coproporphyrinogen-3 oxidase
MQSFALYIHWPFCLSKCPYCDFNSHVRASIDEDSWKKAYIKELTRCSDVIGTRQLTSIFFGGGTPSLMNPKTVEAIIAHSLDLWPAAPNLEITLEANPNSVEVERFHDLKLAGVNRVSVGIQALNDKDLKRLGRQHSAQEAIQAIETATQCFNRVSFDLIYARPDQTTAQWHQELAQALSFGTEHVSLYQLTIEPGTAFEPLYNRGEIKIPDEILAADLFELTQDEMNKHGLPAYEISNHARPDAESRHNLSYWLYEDYLGVGPGAHGRIMLSSDKIATKQYRAPETWLKAVENGSGEEEGNPLSNHEQALEAIMMGLRLTKGVDISNLACPIEEVVDKKSLDILVRDGYLIYSNQQLKSTPRGRQCLNAVLKQLLSIK